MTISDTIGMLVGDVDGNRVADGISMEDIVGWCVV